MRKILKDYFPNSVLLSPDGKLGEIRNKKSRTTFLNPEMLEVTPKLA